MAGLTCAKVLRERGAEVAVFEASDGIGGRVRTDEQNGFLLDRGFQVYFTSYPVAGRHLDYETLDFRGFDPGVIVCRGQQKSVLSDPLRDPKALVPSLLSDAAILGDVRSAGREQEADAVVVATDAPAAGALTGEAVPEGSVGEVCMYYETDGLGSGKKILLNAEDGAFVNNAVEMSNISEKYAPPDRHLLYAVALTGMDVSDEDLYRRGIEDLSRWYPGADFRPLALRRIPYGQFAQPPGIHSRLPENRTQTPGLVLAGEYTEDSSINGSMLSGERAARAVIA